MVSNISIKKKMVSNRIPLCGVVGQFSPSSFLHRSISLGSFIFYIFQSLGIGDHVVLAKIGDSFSFCNVSSLLLEHVLLSSGLLSASFFFSAFQTAVQVSMWPLLLEPKLCHFVSFESEVQFRPIVHVIHQN